MKIKKIIKSAYTVLEESYLRSTGLIIGLLISIFFIGYVFTYLIGYVYIFNVFFLLVYFYILFLATRDPVKLSSRKAKKIEKNDLPEIYRIVENLTMTAGLSQPPKIYLIESPALNAFAAGSNPKNSMVALTTGIIKALNKEEIEGVIAHLISSIKNKDIRVRRLVEILPLIMFFMCGIFVDLFMKGLEGDGSVLSLLIGILLIILAFVPVILAFIFANLITATIFRKRKFMADSNAALLTRNPEGLASALEKIASSKVPLKVCIAPDALYIVDPYPFKKIKPFEIWKLFFRFHPPVEERIKILRSMIIQSRKELNS